MTTYTGVAKDQGIELKVWAVIGGRQVGTVQPAQIIHADILREVNEIKYLHITSPIVGWTRADWFSYSADPAVKVPFAITIKGFKPYVGEFEKE